MSISENFSRSEFACKCGCGFDTVDVELITVLERLRKYAGAPIVINSGCRCAKHNKAEGGADGSLHLQGKAADIVVKGMKPSGVARVMNEWYPNTYGIGEYSNRVHIDVRVVPARWRIV